MSWIINFWILIVNAAILGLGLKLYAEFSKNRAVQQKRVAEQPATTNNKKGAKTLEGAKGRIIHSNEPCDYCMDTLKSVDWCTRNCTDYDLFKGPKVRVI